MDIRRVAPKRIVAGYYCVQSLCTIVWWCLLLFRRESIAWFQPDQWPQEVLLSFFIADLTFLICGSLLVGFAVFRESEWATAGVWLMVGTGWYAALYCLGVSVVTGEAWIASSLMVAMAGLMLATATIHGSANQVPSAIRVVTIVIDQICPNIRPRINSHNLKYLFTS
jgi:peptidoglycan/LPS O-acetylase OafA/YrhL